MSKCPVAQAEIDNDVNRPEVSEIMKENTDAANAQLMIRHREMVESLSKNVDYRIYKDGFSYDYSLRDAIAVIDNQEFWSDFVRSGHGFEIPIAYAFNELANENYVQYLYINGKLPQWHAEINKAIVKLADIALGVDSEEINSQLGNEYAKEQQQSQGGFN